MSDSAEHLEPEVVSESSRRALLGVTAVCVAAVGALAGVPIVRMLAAPLESGADGERWVSLGAVEEFGDERREVVYSYPYQDGWYRASRTRRVVVGKDGEEFVVLSTICTHLGCGVTWMPDDKKFYCPCHDGEFHPDGSVKAGPPRKPLPRLEARVRDGQLEVKES
jgi:menaquinol-cytochrome c reductase iron-sulfur subunit